MRKTGNGIVKQSEESMTLVTAYGFPHHGNRSFTFVQDDALTFPITSDALSSNRHSEWTQEYRMRKQGDGYVIRSEESMTLMTPYRFPHYDALPSAVILTNILYIKLFFYNISRS